MEATLRALLSSPETMLEHRCEGAMNFMQGAGIEDMSTLKQRGEELADALKLKRFERTRLLRALHAHYDAQQCGCRWQVRKTFVEVNDGSSAGHESLRQVQSESEPARSRGVSPGELADSLSSVEPDGLACGLQTPATGEFMGELCALHGQNSWKVQRTFLQVTDGAGAEGLRKVQSEPASRAISPGTDEDSLSAAEPGSPEGELQQLATGESMGTTMTRTFTDQGGLLPNFFGAEAEWVPADQPALSMCAMQQFPQGMPWTAGNVFHWRGLAPAMDTSSFMLPEPVTALEVSVDGEAPTLAAPDDEHDQREAVANSTAVIVSQPSLPAPVLSTAYSGAGDAWCVTCTVPGKLLKGTEKQWLSPSFELPFGPPVPLKIVLYPKCKHDGWGGASFKAAGGKGRVELRCLQSVQGLQSPIAQFRISVGVPNSRGFQKPRGPVTHNFADRPMTGLADGCDMWDFSRAQQNKPVKAFQVCVEFLNPSSVDSSSAAATT